MTTENTLHAALAHALPAYVSEPFSDSPRLKVRELRKALGSSHETVYRWLRTNRLNPRHVRKIVDIAAKEPNLSVLSKLGREVPTIGDFSPFVFM